MVLRGSSSDVKSQFQAAKIGECIRDEGLWGDYWAVLYFDCDGGYMAVCICQNSQGGVLKKDEFHSM